MSKRKGKRYCSAAPCGDMLNPRIQGNVSVAFEFGPANKATYTYIYYIILYVIDICGSHKRKYIYISLSYTYTNIYIYIS